ncbi:MAG: DUF4412 domain-containing protein [Candidatus Aminicenantales bacterium]
MKHSSLNKYLKIATGKKYAISIIIVFSSLILSPLNLRSDVHISKIKHTASFSLMNNSTEQGNERGETWISRNKFRLDKGKASSLIIRLDLEKLYLINHKLKTYSEVDLPLKPDKIFPPPALKLLEEMKVSGEVIDTGEEKKIRKWKCRKYLIKIKASLMDIDIELNQQYWVWTKIRGKLNLYQKFQGEVLLLNPLLKEFMAKIKKIDGYPILIKSSLKMLGAEIKSVDEVVSVERKKAPQGIYELPEGYKMTDYSYPSFLR